MSAKPEGPCEGDEPDDSSQWPVIYSPRIRDVWTHLHSEIGVSKGALPARPVLLRVLRGDDGGWWWGVRGGVVDFESDVDRTSAYFLNVG